MAGSAGFARCYTPVPICMPARAAFWSGRWPHETGVWSNGRAFQNGAVGEGLPTLGSVFSAAGWNCVHFGKQHDSGGLRGFDARPVRRVTPEPGPFPTDYDTAQDLGTTEDAVDFLQNYAGETPYLLAVDLNNPHDICNWMNHHKGRHAPTLPEAELPAPLPNGGVEDLANRPAPVQYVCCAHNRQLQTVGWTADNFREYLAAYQHYTEMLDSSVGQVLAALEARADAAETLVVFFADHGDGLGAHQLATKHTTFYEEIAKVPLWFRLPGGAAGARPGLRNPLVSLLDMFPTLCDLAAVQAPEGLAGMSLAPWITRTTELPPDREYVASVWHTEWGFTVEPGRMIRTERYKYTHYLEGDGEELYDLEADPGETRNLAADAAHAEVLERHRALLRRHVEETGDPYFTQKPEVAPRWRSHPPGYEHHRGPNAVMAAEGKDVDWVM